jgi:hypothetical protein
MKNAGRACTTKQMADACEMFIAAEMTLAGVPARKMPDDWPCYDVVAQPAVVGLRREFLALREKVTNLSNLLGFGI